MSDPPPPSLLKRTIERIIVTADQITQRDPRPYRLWSLDRELWRYIAISAVLVAIGVGTLTLLIRLFS